MGDVTDIRTAGQKPAAIDKTIEGDQKFAHADPKLATWLAALTAHESVTCMHAAAGQVLIHRDHVPSGVFVVLSGDLALSTTTDAADAWAVAADRPYLLPHPAELDLPAGCAARVRTSVDLIHVPRSLMWLAPEIGFLLQHAPIPAISLAAQIPAPGKGSGVGHSAGKVASAPASAGAGALRPANKGTQSATRSDPPDRSNISSK